ncbi:pectate lyase [Actinoalloteichus sp. AHMU CJ021]|uniref:Pectate lyase n=1 Tax=Actinoalloteichus caeruleus DSM 43889 TaxID=1120930 RepID=A0ABT1JGP1_ACTCY|nr:right-handed parallel beta-helix repeat-containing protein [Actinoalloteichus caeruleus]AUS77474.1 pectate lyase [Actinoalloteichus sp. AHMU CJ021]MCP2331336.1 pectate lyase [Actinoalloteichus caeruleus DSM 43889]
MRTDEIRPRPGRQPLPRRGWRRALTALAAVLATAGGTLAVTQSAALAQDSAPVGWASQNGGTTGGAGGRTVTVTNASQLASNLNSSERLIIRVQGMIQVSGMQRVGSNKSILGVGSNSGIRGGGLTINGQRNIIIRNLVLTGSNDDAINIQDGSTNIWIDHNDLSNAYDGLIDIRRGSDFVTVSWNRLHNHDKTSLVGSSDNDGGMDRGRLRVTYHHNLFEGTNQRNPRVRFGNPVHVLNNYFRDVGSYGVSSNIEAGVYVERNYFENVRRPVLASSGTTSPPGNTLLLNNWLDNSGTPEARNGAQVRPIPYGYTPIAAERVPGVVTAGAGVGKIGL